MRGQSTRTKQFCQNLEKAYSSVAFRDKEAVFSVFMWRNGP